MNYLILQSPHFDSSLCEQAMAMVQADTVQKIGNFTACFEGFNQATLETLKNWCHQQHIDLAVLDNLDPLRDLKVLAMDMDSTLINIECIDEIAAANGLKEQVAAITEASMRGEIKDFAESLTKRVALLKGIPVETLEHIYTHRLQLNPGAEQLLQGVKKAGLKTLLVSGGFTFFTSRLKEKLGFDYAFANELEIENGLLTGRVIGPILDGQAKANHLKKIAHSVGASADQCIAIGDGSNDLAMLASVYYSVAYHAKPIVQSKANFQINYCGLDAVLNLFESRPAFYNWI